MASTQMLLRTCPLRSAPFQRGSHNSTSLGAGPGPGSTSSTTSACPIPPLAPSRAVHTGATLDRRDVLLLSSSLVMSHLAQLGGTVPAHAATRGIDRYIRRKTLDPLDTYVPLVLEARALLSQAKDLAAKDVGAARELLRQGPYSGLRDNIRAIGEYAARDGRTSEVGPLVTGFFKALEAYDQLLYGALREKTPVDAANLDVCIADLYAAFDRLLATVPADVLEQATRVLAVTQAKAPVGTSAVEQAAAAAGVMVVDEEAADLVMLLQR